MDSVEKFIQQKMHDLVAASERRLAELRRVLEKIESAADLSELEACEREVPDRLAELAGHFDGVLNGFEDRLDDLERTAMEQALEVRLGSVVEDEGARPDALEATPPSTLVLRLREFISLAEQQLPSLELAKQKLTLARTVLLTLQRQLERQDVSPILRELDRLEIEDLSPIVVELAGLVMDLKRDASQPFAECQRSEAASACDESVAEREAQEERSAAVPELDVTPLSPEDFARYEEDYYHHVGLSQALRKTARTEAHQLELVRIDKRLDRRRQELSTWRSQGGYAGRPPNLISEWYVGALPGESHARGENASANRSNQRTRRKQETAPRGGKAQSEKRRNSRGGIPFEVWAADSWGKDPDIVLRDRNVVLGGAMESNRGRH